MSRRSRCDAYLQVWIKFKEGAHPSREEVAALETKVNALIASEESFTVYASTLQGKASRFDET